MRLNKREYFMALALLVARRSPCLSRRVGCVLVDENDHVIGTGYNGPPVGMPHCVTCRRDDAGVGRGLDECEATHAEQNALLQCRDVNAIRACYVTTAPCAHCLRMLMNTGGRDIFYAEPYRDTAEATARWATSKNGRGMSRISDVRVIVERRAADPESPVAWERV